MIDPDEVAIAGAMEMLSSMQRADDIAHGAGALTAAMGLERFALMDVRGGMLVGLHHNAPPATLGDDIEALQAAVAADPVAARARSSRIPFLWGAEEGGEWRHRHADAGYRAGLVATSWDPAGSGCALMLSCSDARIPAQHVPTLMAYAVMAAASLSGQLQLVVSTQPSSSCPLTERELECLHYVLAGRSTKETARGLGIGGRTVGQYLERARAKLQAKTSRHAVATALRAGWLNVQKAIDLAA